MEEKAESVAADNPADTVFSAYIQVVSRIQAAAGLKVWVWEETEREKSTCWFLWKDGPDRIA